MMPEYIIQATTIKYAGFWRRLAASFFDTFLLVVLFSPLLYLSYGHEYFFWYPRHGHFFAAYGMIDLFLTKIAPIALIVTFWTLQGATPGKRLMQCKVVDATTLQHVSWKQAALRCVAYIISALPFYLGFMWIGWNKRKQGFHDMIAKTVVLHQADDYSQLPLKELMERTL